MGNSPSTGCHITGCPHLSIEHSGFCEEHLRERRRDADKKRGTAVERGYDYRWQQIRKQVLKTEPLCRECIKQNKVVAATEVHHIDGDVRNMDWNNLSPLCHDCHSRITAKAHRD